MMNQYRLRFVGRFVFACKRKKGKGPVTQVTALGMDMSQYEEPTRCHRLFLTVRSRDVKPISARRANFQQSNSRQDEFTVFGVAGKLSVDDQLHLWDIDGCDLSMNAARGITLGRFDLPELSEKVRNGAFDRETWLDSENESPARMRMTLQGGTITTGYREHVVFRRPQKDVDNDVTEVAAEMVEVRLTASGPLKITLRRRRDGRRRAIEIPGATGGKLPPVISLSNLCTTHSAGSGGDVEFGAFYNVLKNPPRRPERKIPHSQVPKTDGIHMHCAFCAKVDY